MAVMTPIEIVSKTGEKLILRSPDIEDVASYVEYWNCIKVETEFTNQYPEKEEPTQEWHKELIQKNRNSKHNSMMSLFNGANKMVANMNIWCAYPDHPWLGHTCDFGIGIIKEYWGVGLGVQMMRELEKHAIQLGFKRLNGGVREHNAVARKLYLKLGFEETGRWPEHALIGGRYLDDIMISKRIQ